MKSKKIEWEADMSALAAFGRTKADAHRDGICIACGTSVEFVAAQRGPGIIYSPEGLREYGISGLCEHCFDNIIASEE